jgi:sugar O-acyltransferase (sialic acid O-acetyltransferase NeuD family)
MGEVCIIGYSGHSYVVCDAIKSMGLKANYYCDLLEKTDNPFKLKYLGSEELALANGSLNDLKIFLAIGDNAIRKKAGELILKQGCFLQTAIHSRSYISSEVSIQDGTVVFAGVVINPMVKIGKGVICNTSSVIEHETTIGDYSHICPGAVIAGNVRIGENVFIGANAVIKQGIIIGDGAIIGAGSVVVKNVHPNTIVYGNPSRIKS